MQTLLMDVMLVEMECKTFEMDVKNGLNFSSLLAGVAPEQVP